MRGKLTKDKKAIQIKINSLQASLKEVLFLYPKSKVTHRAINARQVPCGHALS